MMAMAMTAGQILQHTLLPPRPAGPQRHRGRGQRAGAERAPGAGPVDPPLKGAAPPLRHRPGVPIHSPAMGSLTNIPAYPPEFPHPGQCQAFSKAEVQ